MKKMSYEEGLAQLQALVDGIESGEMTLEETLKAYEKGHALAEKLQVLLTEGRGRIEKLCPDGSRVPLESKQEEEA